ncbi:MAG TPA: MFS transporter, partial [Chloroflexaceae bacterium]|nr:MFS transporter [Chloroflexaceae bacterium]
AHRREVHPDRRPAPRGAGAVLARPGGPLRPLLLPMLAIALVGVGFAAFFQFVPLLAERRGGLAAGALYTIYGLGIIAARVFGGPLLDRWSVGRTLALAAVLAAGGLGLLAVGGPPGAAAVAAVLVAVGLGLSHPALLTHQAALLPAAPGRASAAFYMGFDLGIGAGSILLGVMLQLGGLGALTAAAAVLTLCALPLAPLLTRQRAAIRG